MNVHVHIHVQCSVCHVFNSGCQLGNVATNCMSVIRIADPRLRTFFLINYMYMYTEALNWLVNLSVLGEALIMKGLYHR